MALPELTIIPAGAGSGKTYRIQTTLAQWIQQNDVEAQRIVAVTFTEAAAAELRGRIRDELVHNNRHEDALKLEQAYISTIHGFGLRLLSEFAFDAGLNPSPRMLTEDETQILIRLALAADDQSIDIMKDLARFGYRYDFLSGKGPEDNFRDAVLGLMDKLRSIGRLGVDDKLTRQALQRIGQVYGPVNKAEGLQKNLLAAVRSLLKAFPQDITAQCKLTAGVARNLQSDHRLLCKIVDSDALQRDWSLWQKLRSLQTSTPRNKLPDDYEERIQAIIAAADRLLDHPGPLQDAQDHARALLGTAQSSLSVYAQHKSQRGLLDFTDMLFLTRLMLLEHEDILAMLRDRFQCLVIDEFQDTNPLQFSLLWLFRQAGIPTLVVGDLKQAIMGFQNADARLLQELQVQHVAACSPLQGNWRTHKRLMPWVNDIGRGLFGQHYTELEPKADFTSTLGSLELINFTEGSKAQYRAEHTVARIRDLLNDKSCQVFDRHLKKQRRIRGGDIAVICPRNKSLKDYSTALRAVGIRSRINEDGWFETRIIQLAYHALCFVGDPTDQHAALYLAVTELGGETLPSALATMIDGGLPQIEVLTALLPLREQVADCGISEALAKVIEALDLYGFVSTQDEAAQARANLLRLQAEAAEFEKSNREALASGGYYGNELKSFLAWLIDRAGREDEQPEPRVQDEDAVQLVTWHRSKGREWPVVVVAATESNILCKLPGFDVNYEDFTDLNQLLDKARLDISPLFDAPEKNDAFLAELWPEAQDSAFRLLYVALTRAREKIILEWPGYLDNGKERKDLTYWEYLVAKTGMYLDANRLRTNGHDYDCRVIQVGKERSELFETDHSGCAVPLPVIGRRAIVKQDLPGQLTPETVSPSLHADIAAEALETVTEVYSGAYEGHFDLPANEQGTLLHRCFEVLDKIDSCQGLCRATGFEFTAEQFNEIQQQAHNFYSWLDKTYPGHNRRHEVSILATDEQGSVISGIIDLLVETEAGFWIIDHKSDRTDDRDVRFKEHYPQLLAYRSAVIKLCPEKPVLGVAINWISYGEVIFMANEMNRL